jgi:hypothetical protein
VTEVERPQFPLEYVIILAAILVVAVVVLAFNLQETKTPTPSLDHQGTAIFLFLSSYL